MQVFRTCFSKLRFQLIPCKPQKILHSPETAEISAEKPSHNYYRRNRRQQHPYRIPDPFPRNCPLINCGNNRPNRRKLRLKQAREQQERKNLNRCFRPVSFILFFQNLFSFLFHFHTHLLQFPSDIKQEHIIQYMDHVIFPFQYLIKASQCIQQFLPVFQRISDLLCCYSISRYIISDSFH